MSIVNELERIVKPKRQTEGLEFLDEVEDINELLWRFVSNYSPRYSCELIEMCSNEEVEDGVLKELNVISNLKQAIRKVFQNNAARLDMIFAYRNKGVIFQYENYLFRSREIDEEIEKYELVADEIRSRLNKGLPGFNSGDYQRIISFINNLEQRKGKAFLYIKVLEVDSLEMVIDDLVFSKAYK
ncbi:hypothetical protein GF352_02300 [archaeon]|nr:hypothetical protein [archaeon]